MASKVERPKGETLTEGAVPMQTQDLPGQEAAMQVGDDSDT